MTTFKDYFSKTAVDYAASRPDYPLALFACLAELAAQHELAWDCGTGNGQAAAVLADYFKQVIATDPSAQQIQAAIPKSNVTYQVSSAEQSALLDQSIDLITVAQALHWFDFEKFYQEVRRVLKPDGVIAVWSYGLPRIDPEVNRVIDHLYWDVTKAYWDERRKLIDEEYKTIPFPFQKLTVPPFQIEKDWDLTHFMRYLSTWSGLQAYIKQTGNDPLQQCAEQFATAWGNPTAIRRVTWPIYLLAGKC